MLSIIYVYVLLVGSAVYQLVNISNRSSVGHTPFSYRMILKHGPTPDPKANALSAVSRAFPYVMYL